MTRLIPRLALTSALLSITACRPSDRPASVATGGGDTLATTVSKPGEANPDPAQNTYVPALGITLSDFKQTPSGLYIHDVKEGTGPVAASGQTVSVHYTGWLPNGKQFDSSKGAAPIEFVLGQSQVISGWDEGIAGMKVGGQRRLVIPAKLGYGSTGSPPDIPPFSVLVFDVELVGAK